MVHLVGVLFNIVIEDARNHKPEIGLYLYSYSVSSWPAVG
jgi:hypothetical protein